MITSAQRTSGTLSTNFQNNSPMKYAVKSITTLVREYTVDAETPEEALAIAEDRHLENDYDDEEIDENWEIE